MSRMSERRYELQALLEELLGSKQVYFQRPENVKMKYPAIVYSLADIDNLSADDISYVQNIAYDVTVIDKNPDSETAAKIALLPLCRLNPPPYVSDNLNHFVFKLYY